MHGRYARSVKILPLNGKTVSINNVSLGFLLTSTIRYLWQK